MRLSYFVTLYSVLSPHRTILDCSGSTKHLGTGFMGVVRRVWSFGPPHHEARSISKGEEDHRDNG